MAASFSLDFLLLSYLATLGILQMAAAYNNLRGLLVIRVNILAFLFGLMITIAAFLWFFLSKPRNLPDTQGGLDGNDAAGLFSLGSLAALFTTFIISSAVNHSLGKNNISWPNGLEALRETTYLRALLGSLKVLWKRS